MTDNKQAGLMKKLLFPSYADAGSNETFGPPPEGDGGASDATTAILDNRTPQQHDSDNREQAVLDSSLLTHTGASNDDDVPPASSTDPPLSPKPTRPQSRPMSMAARSLSTTTRSGVFPTTSPRVHVDQPPDRFLEYSSSVASTTGVSSSEGGENDAENANLNKSESSEQDPTPVKDNRTADVFQPRLSDFINDGNTSEILSDVNSTASEMGTVIDAPSRLAEVQAMAAALAETDVCSPAELSLPTLEEEERRNEPPRTRNDKRSPAFRREQMDSVFRKSQPQQEMSSSASALVSAAVRRLGSSRAHSSTTNDEPHSAPSTPRRVEDYLRSSLPFRSTTTDQSTAHLLRSPGSAAHFSRKQKKPFAHRGGREDRRLPIQRADSLSSPLRYVRGCLSHDSTLDEPPTRNQSSSKPPKSPRPSRSSIVQSQSWDVTSSSLGKTIQETPKTPVGGYRSFAFGKSPDSSSKASRIRKHVGAKTSLDDVSPAVANADSRNTLMLKTPQRVEMEREDALDILSCLVERSAAFDNESRVETIQEEEPNNGENKPEDDRVSTFADIGARTVETRDLLNSPPKTKRLPREVDSFSSDLMDAVQMLRKISQDYELKSDDAEKSESIGHSMRMKAVDELLRSHTYAAEMRRAAKSASSWLRSIDRPGSSSDVTREVNEEASIPSTAADGKNQTRNMDRESNQSAGEEQEPEHHRSSREKMDMVGLKALLHSAEAKAKENEDLALRLNEELSKCRAEIGRLKSASRGAGSGFMNRSILDSEGESSSSVATSTQDISAEKGLDGVLDDASPIPRVDTERDSIEASFIRSDVVLEKKTDMESDEWSRAAEAKRELVLVKAALLKANETIRRLHRATTEGSDVDDANVPIVSVDNPELTKELEDYKAAVRKAHASKAAEATDSEVAPVTKDTSQSPSRSVAGAVNVRMLDGENFVTEWDDLAPSLPPPPDHGLRSPIVEALLQQWTSDASMQDSLLSWMDRIMNGANPATVPPLTISSLDHQTRDGFVMHIIPLLLRRSDIHVDVKTRAHRRTSYDVSVSITRSVPSEQGADHFAPSQLPAPATEEANKIHVMAFQASRGHNTILEESALADSGSPTPMPHKASEYFQTSSLAHSSDVGSDSVAHSTSTALVTNSSKRFSDGPSRNEQSGVVGGSSWYTQDRDPAELIDPVSTGMFGDDISTSSSTTGGSSQKSAHQSGLMRSLGGAFGGLLTRKTSEHHPVGPGFEDGSYAAQESDSVPQFLHHPPSPSRGDDEQPYHRVVSAPPGRIGVTFVEYRGHAMVSDVAPESPLSGWVFPSDILIAIDEVPVSGMRVREIVKLLTSRKERQRALRVISSHAMNEFTMNTTTPSEVGAPS